MHFQGILIEIGPKNFLYIPNQNIKNSNIFKIYIMNFKKRVKGLKTAFRKNLVNFKYEKRSFKDIF